MSDAGHKPRRREAADEEADEMRRAEQADLAGRKPQRRAGQRVERAERSGAELHQQNGQEKRCEGDEEAHGADGATGSKRHLVPDSVSMQDASNGFSTCAMRVKIAIFT